MGPEGMRLNSKPVDIGDAMKTSAMNINTAIVSAIPIDKHLKRYFINKYDRLVEHNGIKYASNIFKTMREISLAYRADTHRMEKRDFYISQFPCKKTGWVKKLFQYLDNQPYDVLNFLKLYVGMNDPLVTVEESANTEDAYLASREKQVNTDVPVFLKTWLQVIKMPLLTEKGYYHLQHCILVGKHPSNNKYQMKTKAGLIKGKINQKQINLLKKFVSWHTYEEYLAYFRKWKDIIHVHIPSDSHLQTLVRDYEPLPEMYCDSQEGQGPTLVRSESLESDLYQLASMRYASESYFNEPPLTTKSLQYVEGFLNPNLWIIYDDYLNDPLAYEGQKSFIDGNYVGHIHHIPKKGTVKRRPIAVPNRFLQMALVPAADIWERLVRNLPQDATFNQSKFDTKIVNRVTNPNLYVGSVDLSQATDNLPLAWGEAIWEHLFSKHVSKYVQDSWDLFTEMSQSKWENDGMLTQWTVGQPLGSLDSFRVLAATHNLFLESLAFSLGYGHSPYCVLGDDLLIFTKKLRKAYIREMSNRGIPLSLHKSYEGNLVEFAGKIYIKNFVPRYSSDHAPIGIGNLYDYQRATHTLIPWDMLPSKVRKQFTKLVHSYGVSDNSLIPLIYSLGQWSFLGRSSHPTVNSDEGMQQEYFNQYYLDEEKPTPDRVNYSGIVNCGNHPVTYLDYGYAEKHGYKLRTRRVSLPEWYKHKFRPDSTDKIARCATKAVINIKGQH